MIVSGTKILIAVLIFTAALGVRPGTVCGDTDIPCIFEQASDVSAAAAVDRDMFVAADDENNILKVYKIKQARPILSYDLTGFLGIQPEHPEADIEGATTVNDRIYWITSHGRSQDGKIRPNRCRFFATDIKVSGDSVTIKPIGTPCRDLIDRLIETDAVKPLHLERTVRPDTAGLTKKQQKALAPKKEGLNIEGLCASPDGRKLYIGFRNPLILDPATSREKALVVSLNNPADVIEKKAQPVFGGPLLFDLGGRGIRDMAYLPSHKEYLIVAGPRDNTIDFALYSWSGDANTPPVLIRPIRTSLDSFKPEALVVFKDSEKLLLLSDDGDIPVDVKGADDCIKGKLQKDGRCLNKHLIDENKKHFRGLWLYQN